MDRVVLTAGPTDLPDVAGGFAVVAPGYAVPTAQGRPLPVVGIEDLIRAPSRWLAEPTTMVVVGLSRLMTPSNRVRLGQVLHDRREGLRRVSVDEVLFVSEPWRLWWHFHTVGVDGYWGGPWGFTDSYLAETRWRQGLEGRGQDPFGVEPVLAAARGVVRAVRPFQFGPLQVEVREVSSAARQRYLEEKGRAFEVEKTPQAIVRRLARLAQELEPARALPAFAALWPRRPAVPVLWPEPVRVVCTDLGVDGWLVGQIRARVELTNALAGVGG